MNERFRRADRLNPLRSLLGPLQVFACVHRSEGIAQAAEALHVTPGAISQQLKELEAQLKVQLFYKEGRRLALTAAGRKLAVTIADLFDRVEAAVREVAVDERRPKLRLRVMPSFAIRWLVPRLASFYARHPDIEVELATISSMQESRLEQADFVVLHGEGEWRHLHFDHIFDDALVPVCSPGMAREIKRPLDVQRAHLLHSLMRPGDWQIWFNAAGLVGEPNVGTRLGNAALCYQAAVDGVGVAIAQRDYVAEDLASGRLVAPLPLVATTQKGYYLVCEPGRADTFPLSVFRAWMRSVCSVSAGR
jgi:LysR family glycine cleavage system transcriptional activator/LysR family transcriptional regulator of beta-lactamase